MVPLLTYTCLPGSTVLTNSIFLSILLPLSARSVDDCNILSLNSRVLREKEPFRGWNLIFFVSATLRTSDALKLLRIKVTSIFHLYITRLGHYFLTSRTLYRVLNPIVKPFILNHKRGLRMI